MSQQLTSKNQTRSSEASLESQIISLDSRIDKISIGKSALESHASQNDPFNFEVDIKEIGRSDDKLKVEYAFSFGKHSSGQMSRVSGVALIGFSHFGPKTDLQSLGEHSTTQMAVEIFRKNFESIYLLHATLGMDAPSPWIMQGVRLS